MSSAESMRSGRRAHFRQLCGSVNGRSQHTDEGIGCRTIGCQRHIHELTDPHQCIDIVAMWLGPEGIPKKEDGVDETAGDHGSDLLIAPVRSRADPAHDLHPELGG